MPKNIKSSQENNLTKEIELISGENIRDKIYEVMNKLNNVVEKSEIAPFLLDLGKPAEKHEYLFLNGEPAKADETYINLYSQAKNSIYLVDNYINIKTLRLLQGIKPDVKVIVFSDNTNNYLHASDYEDFTTEFPNISIDFYTTNNIMHDRYIILDFDTKDERIFHAGASSKDAGKKVTSIIELTEADVKLAFHTVVERLRGNPKLALS